MISTILAVILSVSEPPLSTSPIQLNVPDGGFSVNQVNQPDSRPSFPPNGTISTLNSTTIPLGANQVFTGEWENDKEYSAIIVSVASNVPSAPGGLRIEWSPDGVNSDVSQSTTFLDGTARAVTLGPQALYFRLKYINGPTAQSFFRVQTLFSKNPIVNPIINQASIVGDPVSPAVTGTQVKSITFGLTSDMDGGIFMPIEAYARTPDAGAVGLVTRPIGPLEVKIDGGVLAVTQGTNPWVTIGPLTNSELRSSPTNVFVDGGQIVANQGGTWTVQQGNAPWTVSLGATDSKTNVLKTGTITTTTLTADQVVLTYTVTAGKTLFVQGWDCHVHRTNGAGTFEDQGTCSLESPSGTKLWTEEMHGDGDGRSNPVLIAEPMSISAGTVIRFVVTPRNTTSYIWRANLIGYER